MPPGPTRCWIVFLQLRGKADRDHEVGRLPCLPAHYPTVLKANGEDVNVVQELMRHASIQTTMNIYGKAMTDSKRQAHSKVVEMVLNSSKNDQTADQKKPVAAIRS